MNTAVAQDDNSSDDALVQDAVIVTGVRASLAESLDQKRRSNSVIDAVTAEDIGKFPDLNIGEALARVPGVTLTRSVGGEGNRVSVRGGQTDWTNVTVNGLTVATGNQGREFDFDIFASELFAGATVYKSPTASVLEGGLAATIDLQTPKPFDYGNTISVSASVTDEEKGNGETLPRASGLISHQFNDRLGVVASIAYSETSRRGDVSEGWGWDNNNRGLETYLSGFTQATAPTIEVNGTPVDDLATLQNLAATTITPELPRLGPQALERERLGLTGAVQFRATDSIELFADALYAEFTQDELRATIDGIPGFNLGKEWTSITINDDGVALAGTIQNQSQRSETLFREIDTTLTHVMGGAVWQIDDIWSASAILGYSRAEEDELSRTYIWNHVGEFTYDFSQDPRYPNLGGANWLDPSEFVSQQTRFRPFQREDEETTIKVDVEAQFDDSIVQGLKAGFVFRDRSKGQTRLAEIRQPFTADFADYSIAATALFDDYHTDSPFRSDFLLTNIGAAGRDILPADLSVTEVDRLQTYTVGAETTGAYIQTDLEFDIVGMPLSIDSGVRFVRTEVASNGFQQEAGGPAAVSFPGEYNDWLPSLNARLGLTEDLVLRFAANRTMTRPPLANISPSVAIFPTIESARRGNPGLEPFRSNNVDLSLEWYFANEALISATAYYKDVESFIVSETRDEVIECSDIRNDSGENICGRVFQVTSPFNGENGELYGLELQYQQPFTFLPVPFDGFGVLANATFAESERTTDDGTSKPLAGQSDTAYNLVGYYEKGPFSGRVAYNYRSEFTTGGRNGFDNVTEEYGQIDVSARYAITENIDLFFEGLNLGKEDIYRYQVLTAADGSVEDFDKVLNDTFVAQGRVLQLGIRAKF